MNSLERVLNTVQGKPKDRTAVSLTLSLYGARLLNCPLQEYYTNSELYAEGQSAVKEMFNPDILFTPFVLTAIGEAFGSRVKYFKEAPPNMVRPAFTTAEELLKFDIASLENNKRLNYILESAKKLVSNYGENTAIAGIFLSPVDLPPIIIGMDAWLETVLFNEKEALKICELMSRFFVKFANVLFSIGIHFLALPVVFCNPNVIFQSIVNEMVMPVLFESFKQLNGLVVLHHGGAPMNAFLGTLTTLPNIVGYVIDKKDKFDYLRKLIPVEKLLLGNIDGPTLNKRTPEQIQNHCMYILKNRVNDPHFILATSGPDVPFSTSHENIHAVIQSAKNFNK
jgi:uroporphyrinogen decarboxylase